MGRVVSAGSTSLGYQVGELAAHSAPRALMSKRATEKCGCAHKDGRWIVQCKEHKDEDDALHQRALEDHRRNERERREQDSK